MRATSASSGSSSSASTTTATSTRARLLGPVLRLLRGVLHRGRRSSTACAPTTARRPSGSRRRTTSSGCRPTRSGCSQLYDERPDFVLPGFRANEARSFIEGGLQDISVSRAGQPWGIPIPWDESQVAYVWVDALINYLSALTYARDGEDLRDRFWPRGAAPDRQGHPPVPLHHLAGAAPRRRLRGSAAGVRPRLSAARRPEDLEVARQRRSTRSSSPTSTAPTRSASGARGRCRSDRTATPRSRACTSATSGSSGNDLGNLLSRTTAMIARYRDGAIGRTAGARAACALDELRVEVAERIDRFDITGALDVVWLRRAPAQPVRRVERPVADREGREPGGRARRASSRPRRGSLRGRDRALRLPPDHRAADSRSAAPERRPRAGIASARAAEPADGIEAAAPLFPRVDAPDRRGVIDTHAHLDACDEPPDELVARAREAGVDRIVTIGCGIDSCRARSRSPRPQTGVYAALGVHPHQAARRRRRAASTSCASCSPTSARSPSARPGSTSSATTRLTTGSASSSAPARARRRARQARRRPHARRRRRDRCRAGAASAAPSSCTASRRRRSCPRRSSTAGTSRSPATSPTRRPPSCARRRRASRADRHPRRDRQPVPRAAGAPRPPERARQRRAHGRCPRRGARRGAGRARRPDRRQRDRRVRAPLARDGRPEEGARPALPRRREPARRDRPARRARARRRRPRDRAGLGVLTAYLADRVAHVHAVELDRSLEPRSARASAAARTSTLDFGDALAARPRRARAARREARLEPPVQRRHAARRREPRRPAGASSCGASWCSARSPTASSPSPSTKAYGAVSVLVQLAARAHGFPPGLARGLPAAPERRLRARRLPPRAASGRLRHGEATRDGRVRAPAQDARELARARRARIARRGGRGARARSAAAPSVRAEELSRPSSSPSPPRSPHEPRAGARQAQPRARRRAAAATTASHEVTTVLQRLDLADESPSSRRPRSARRRASPTTRSSRGALDARSPPQRASSRASRPDREAHPGRRRPRRRQLRRRNRAPARQRPAPRAAPTGAPARARRAARRGRPLLPRRRARSSARATAATSRRSTLPQDYAVVLVLPHGQTQARHGRRLPRLRRARRRRRLRRAAASALAALGAVRAPRDLAALPPNDLAASPLAAELRDLGAFRADVTGAGPAVYGLFEHGAPAGGRGARARARGRVWITAPAW